MGILLCTAQHQVLLEGEAAEEALEHGWEVLEERERWCLKKQPVAWLLLEEQTCQEVAEQPVWAVKQVLVSVT